MDEPTGFISTVQIGITVFGIALGAVGEPLVSEHASTSCRAGVAFAISFVILTYLSVALGELVPKSIALQTRGDARDRGRAVPLYGLQKVTAPVVWVLQMTANACAATLRLASRPRPGELAHTEEDIRRSSPVPRTRA